MKPGEKKAQRQLDGAFLDWALESFSGYVAADELYEGPYCVLSVVDNRCYKRILYEVLDHDPTHDDITPFFERLKSALSDRELTLQGITTDGSPLYPEPIRTVFGDVPHQIWGSSQSCHFSELTSLHFFRTSRGAYSQTIPTITGD